MTSSGPMNSSFAVAAFGFNGPFSACMRMKYSKGTSMRPRMTYVLTFPSSSAHMYVSRTISDGDVNGTDELVDDGELVGDGDGDGDDDGGGLDTHFGK